MKRIAMLVCVAVLAASMPASAQTAAGSGAGTKHAASRTTDMHPHQLTLYPHGKPERRQPAYSYSRHRFDQPSAIHNTFVGPR